MAENPRLLKHKVTGAVWVLPPCGPDTDAVYEASGWADAPAETPWPDLLAEQWATSPTPEPAVEAPVDPESSTKAELTETATGLGIDVPSSATKAEIAALIEGAQTSQEP